MNLPADTASHTRTFVFTSGAKLAITEVIKVAIVGDGDTMLVECKNGRQTLVYRKKLDYTIVGNADES